VPRAGYASRHDRFGKAGKGGAVRGGSGRRSRRDRSFPLDGFQYRRAAAVRRRAVAVFAIAVIVLAGTSVVLAWRQYDDAKAKALTDLDARVVAVSGVINASFQGEIATLDAMAKAPAVIGEQTPVMDGYFRRVQPSGGQVFSAGISWIDRTGRLRATSTGAPAKQLLLSDRTYFKTVLATGRPYVSGGLISRGTNKPVVVVAVPTYTSGGRVSGVLAGGIELTNVKENQKALDLGFGDLEIIDRGGHLLLDGIAPTPNKALVSRMQRSPSGVLSGTRGLSGAPGHVVAFSAAAVPGWLVTIDRPSASVFASARRSLTLNLVSVGAALVFILAALAFLGSRMRRGVRAEDARVQAWSVLTRGLTSATTSRNVVDALVSALTPAFDGAVVIVAVDDGSGRRVKAASRTPQAQGVVQSAHLIEQLAELGQNADPRTVDLDGSPAGADLATVSAKQLRWLHTVPIVNREKETAGAVCILGTAGSLAPGEWALLESAAVQAMRSLERAQLFAQEHELAVRLQRSLLPDRLPHLDGVELAGHYLAGATAMEVGGDWYDAVLRPDGVLQLCVGDVSGRGIGAATVMGRQRNTFEAYALECRSPAEIIRRMLRHVRSDEMITLACVSIDPATAELTYSCAGHPPPLLLDRETGRVARLDQASAPPVGVAAPGEVIERRLALPAHAAVAMYTDGLIERRGESIDDAIDLLGDVLADGEATAAGVVARIGEAIGSPADDVALLLVGFDAARWRFDVELPAEPGSLKQLRSRLRAWLERRGVGAEQVAELVLAASEACNNAIEHAYPEPGGTVTVRVEETGDTLRLVVEDRGRWIDPIAAGDRGRGITLMKQLMDSAKIESGPNGTRVTLVQRIRPATLAEPEYANR
jgi:anti-sigma regulatory factor (Ser/Thr protein kinase)